MAVQTQKTDIIDSLYKIMCSATSTVSDSRVQNNDYFKRRVLGFKAEIEFQKMISEIKNIRYLDGGQFISKKISGQENESNEFLYTTISSDEPEKYVEVYDTVSKWNKVVELFFIRIDKDNWDKEDFEIKLLSTAEREVDKILKPCFKFYSFSRDDKKFNHIENGNFDLILNKFESPARRPSLYNLRKRDQFDYFADYDLNTLIQIYATRYFLDVIMRMAQGRQIIDLDGFLVTSGKLTLVEIKEKSPIINNSDDISKWQYGWDSRRILWYLYLYNNINLPVLYNVRQINNREERKFVQWDSIYIYKFLEGVSWSNSRGGGGGEDTLLAPYSFFSRLESLL